MTELLAGVVGGVILGAFVGGICVWAMFLDVLDDVHEEQRRLMAARSECSKEVLQ